MLTSSVVAAVAGPSLEIALKYAVVPALSIWIGDTATTPDVELMSFCRLVSRGSLARGSVCEPPDEEPPDELDEPDEAGWAGDLRVTAISSGPFVPGPKPLLMRSYAWRAVVDVDWAATSCRPSVSESSGTISGSRIASATRPATTGYLAISAAHFAQRPCLMASSLGSVRTRNALMRPPVTASSAGSRVGSDPLTHCGSCAEQGSDGLAGVHGVRAVAGDQEREPQHGEWAGRQRLKRNAANPDVGYR